MAMKRLALSIFRSRPAQYRLGSGERQYVARVIIWKWEAGVRIHSLRSVRARLISFYNKFSRVDTEFIGKTLIFAICRVSHRIPLAAVHSEQACGRTGMLSDKVHIHTQFTINADGRKNNIIHTLHFRTMYTFNSTI